MRSTGPVYYSIPKAFSGVRIVETLTRVLPSDDSSRLPTVAYMVMIPDRFLVGHVSPYYVCMYYRNRTTERRSETVGKIKSRQTDIHTYGASDWWGTNERKNNIGGNVGDRHYARNELVLPGCVGYININYCHNSRLEGLTTLLMIVKGPRTRPVLIISILSVPLITINNNNCSCTIDRYFRLRALTRRSDRRNSFESAPTILN